MTIRHFNYTDRARILRDDVPVSITRGDDGLVFAVTPMMESYQFPPSAKVFVEVREGWHRKRCAFGTVGTLQVPPESERELGAFRYPESLSFRVLVVDTTDAAKGLLLGEADNLRAVSPDENPQSGESLLPVEPADDMGQQVWSLDLEGEPRLRINSAVSQWKSLAADPVFAALVYPSVLRQILFRIVSVERYSGGDNLDNWMDRWLYFARALGAGEPPEVGDDISEETRDQVTEWIDLAVDQFARRHASLATLQGTWSGGGEG
jgi:hypothetical protein